MQGQNEMPAKLTWRDYLSYVQGFFSGTSTSSSSSIAAAAAVSSPSAASAAAAVSASSTAAISAAAILPAASIDTLPESSSPPMEPAEALAEKTAVVSREHMYIMLMLRKREGNIFSGLPRDVFFCLMNVEQYPNSDIAIALRLAADGEEQAINELTAMLDCNPRLLLQAGNVMTRGGLYVKRVTLYEFFLGAGDPGAAARITPYFERIDGGESQRMKQYARYKPHIDGMLTQKPYDLVPLFTILKGSSAADVTALLKDDMTHESNLRDALIKFRSDHAPGKLIKPRMHYNYKTLEQAFNLLYDEWNSLSNNDSNYDKCDFVARLVIGYLQRGLPAIDRIAFARAFADKERTLNFKYVRGRFPDTSAVALPGDSLGFSHFIYGGGRRCFGSGRGLCSVVAVFRRFFKIHVEQKLQTYRTYTDTPASARCSRVCDLLR